MMSVVITCWRVGRSRRCEERASLGDKRGYYTMRGICFVKYSWEFLWESNFKVFVVNLVNFGISSSASLWFSHCRTFFIEMVSAYLLSHLVTGHQCLGDHWQC